MPSRIEVNVVTGEVIVQSMTQEELAEAAARRAIWDAENTLDNRAARAVDAQERLIFEIHFDAENRLRSIEGRPSITRAQYRDALISRWKTINS